MNISKKYWRKFTSSTILLWLLIIVVILAVWLIIYAWKLHADQALGAIVAASAIPLAFLSQRSILREDQRQKMRYEAYNSLLPHVEKVQNVLAGVSVSELKSYTDMYHHSQGVMIALRDFINTYHSHEMVFVNKELSFKYLHFSLMKLANMIDRIESEEGNSFSSDARRVYSSSAKHQHIESKEFARDIASYFFDLKKDLIESLGFSKVTGTYIKPRKPNDKKHKLLNEIATKKAVEKLEKECMGDFSNE